MNLPVERDALKPHLNKKIVLTGHFRRFDSFHDYHSRREYPCAILESCFLEGGDVMVADHLWVHRAEGLRGLEPELDIGELVQLTATVRDYSKRRLDQTTGKMGTVTSYYLDRPEGVKLPNREAIAHRNGVDVKSINTQQFDWANTNGNKPMLPPIPPPRPPQPAAPPAPPVDYFQLIQDTKALAKRCGGLGRLRDLVQLLLEE